MRSPAFMRSPRAESSWTASCCARPRCRSRIPGRTASSSFRRSEEHTSELQSLTNLVCRLLLEKKKKKKHSKPQPQKSEAVEHRPARVVPSAHDARSQHTGP